MKKKLESDLISIAHRILKLKGKEEVLKLHAEASALYEALSVLKFAHENFEEDIPTIGSDSSFFEVMNTVFNNKVSDNIEVEDRVYVNLDDVEDDGIMEPAIEKIKDIVAQMPQETHKIDEVIQKATTKPLKGEHDLETLTADFKEMPEFEPIDSARLPEKKTLNDTIKKGVLNIGLNDKLAFIKHLFEGKNEDYDRVLSQINTMPSLKETQHFINTQVKPDYNNWEGKEAYEARFIEILESKFN